MAAIVISILQIASLALVARALLSWFRTRPGSTLEGVKRSIDRVTDPVVVPVRRRLPSLGGIDFSVMAIVLAINFFLIPVAATL
ncbi:MAG: YggT family protein [Acidimicrobiales bacterium]|nr:YggT family protein [Acidimicrobiales bacterium]